VSNFAFSQNANLSILKSINQKEYPEWDNAMRFTSDGVAPFMGISTFGLLMTGYIKKDDALVRSGYKMAISQGLNILITESMKRTIKEKRPYDAYPNDIILRHSTHGFSFPSGHTSNAFCTATALTLGTKKWYIGVPAFTYAGLVAYSRMRLGAHYPGDVLAGIIIGVGSSLLTWQVDKWVNHK
jgi:membrane-associated phospholipid phosphatase